MFKHFLTACMGVLMCGATMQAIKPVEVEVPEGMTKGFIGTPLLSSNGFKAESGEWMIGLGQGGFTNLDNITNDDPMDYASSANLAELTLGFNEYVKIIPDDTFEGTRQKIKSGDRIGFVISFEGSSVDVLKLDLAQMFCLNFFKAETGYKLTDAVTTTHANHDNLDVLGLGLISAQLGDKSQQVSLDVPYGKDGEEYEFDGFSLSVGGVDVNVLEQMRIRYCYLDNFVEVPLIKRYFHNVTAKSAGMTSGAKYLIDNNLENGASTAVLNIGGNYYTIMNDKPFPGGIEFGFHITEGTVLDLDLGKAMRIYAMTYPLDANGDYDTTKEPIVASEMSVNFNVVGLNAVGGGKTVVCTVADPGVPFFGVKLDVIKGVSLELGATVYHYAYVKLPKMPEIDLPFYAPFHIIPSSNFDTSKANSSESVSDGLNQLRDGYYTNTYHNTFLMDNDAEQPLTNDNSYWIDHTYPTFSKFATMTNRTRNLSMTLGRRTIYDDGTEGDFEAVAYVVLHTATTGTSAYTGTPKAELNWYEGNTLRNDIVDLEYKNETDGIFDLSKITLALQSVSRDFGFNAENDKSAIAFEYALYLPNKDNDLTLDKLNDLDNAIQISTDYLVIPAINPYYEMAGAFSKDEVESASQQPADEMVMNGYGNYVIIDIPEFLDEKVEVESVDLLEYEAYEGTTSTSAGRYYDFSRINVNTKHHYNLDPKKDAADAEFIAHIDAPGISKVVAKIDNDVRDYVEVNTGDDSNHWYNKRMENNKCVKYFVVANLKYKEAFLNKITAMHPGMADMQNNDLHYAFVATSTPQHVVPIVELVGDIESEKGFGKVNEDTEEVENPSHVHWSTWTVSGLEDLTEGHAAYAETDPIHFTQWWMTAPVAAPEAVVARAADANNWTVGTSHNEAQEDAGYVRSTEYETSSNGTTTSHTAVLGAVTPAADKDYNLDLHTRAYVPVRPSGVTAEVPASYIALQSTGNTTVNVADLGMSGVEDITLDSKAPVEYFNLQGQPVTNPANGIYLRRQGNTVTKIALH